MATTAAKHGFTIHLPRFLRLVERKIKGELKWPFSAADKDGDTIDVLLSAKREEKAALRFLKKAILQQAVPEKINADKSGANPAGLNEFHENHETVIELRQVKYLNNIVEQDDRPVRQRIRPMMGSKSFISAAKIIYGIEMMIKIKKGQVGIKGSTTFEQL